MYIAIGSDQKLAIFFVKQVRQMITNASLSNVYIMKHYSDKKEICRMRHHLSRNVHEIILFCINQHGLKEFAVVQPVAFVMPLEFNMRSNIFVSLGKKSPSFCWCVSGGCGGNALFLMR